MRNPLGTEITVLRELNTNYDPEREESIDKGPMDAFQSRKMSVAMEGKLSKKRT